jgi:hypothetical protein
VKIGGERHFEQPKNATIVATPHLSDTKMATKVPKHLSSDIKMTTKVPNVSLFIPNLIGTMRHFDDSHA